MKKDRRFSWSALSAELTRRRVYPVVAAYAITSWIILQIGEVTFEPLNLPGWVMTGLIIVVILGFPTVIALAWVYDLTAAGIKRDRLTFPRVPEAEEKPTVAVLPFMDLSPNADQRYFCDGIAEAILNALTTIPELSVVARSSSFQFAGHAGDVREIGRALHANAILEGSLRKSDGHIRVTAQLVKTSDGYHLWAKNFDAELKDLFAIQDEIATSIANALIETIGAKYSIKAVRSKDVTAYDYYLRGRQFLRRFNRMEIEWARQMFRQAIKIDEEFALAWSGYADCHSLLNMYEDPKPGYRGKALEASKRALELDSGLAEAHASRGLAYLVCSNYDAAENEFKKSLELNPQLYEAFYYYGRTRFHQGDLDMAAELFRKAAEADPSDYKSRCLRVQILRGLGRTAEAVKVATDAVAIVEKNLSWNPDDASAYHLGAGSLIALGEFDRARRWLRRALEIDSDDSVLLYNVACNLATMGESDSALDYLERAIDHGVINAAWMKNDNDLASLRAEPRFAGMLARVEKSRERACEIS